MRARRRIVQLLHYFNLEAEINDFEEIHDAILRDMAFKGTNLWILLFAAIIASVGLNVNSTAVLHTTTHYFENPCNISYSPLSPHLALQRRTLP